MRRTLKFLGIAAAAIAAGMIVAVFIALVAGANAFNLDRILLGNWVFIVSFVFSIIGGIVILYRFVSFSRKVKKNRTDEEVEEDERIIETDVRWDYAILLAGVVLLMISYYLVL